MFRNLCSHLLIFLAVLISLKRYLPSRLRHSRFPSKLSVRRVPKGELSLGITIGDVQFPFYSTVNAHDVFWSREAKTLSIFLFRCRSFFDLKTRPFPTVSHSGQASKSPKFSSLAPSVLVIHYTILLGGRAPKKHALVSPCDSRRFEFSA